MRPISEADIERVTGQCHYNPGTLQKITDAIKAAKGEAWR